MVRLNSLYDIQCENVRYEESDRKKFNLSGISINISKNFRIIGIYDYAERYNLSPSFINRFIPIQLENQLENINIENIKKLIEILFHQMEKKVIEKDLLYERVKGKLGTFTNEKEVSCDGVFNEKDEEENENLIKKFDIQITKTKEDQNEKSKYLILYLAEMINKKLKKSNSIITIKDISRLCFSLKKIMKFNFFYIIDTKKLIDFIYDILFNEDQF